MNQITQVQKEAAKARIFDDLASAISQTSHEDWRTVVIRAESILQIAKQLEDGVVAD